MRIGEERGGSERGAAYDATLSGLLTCREREGRTGAREGMVCKGQVRGERDGRPGIWKWKGRPSSAFLAHPHHPIPNRASLPLRS